MRTIRARFNGTHIELEEPINLKPDAKLLVTVLEDDMGSETAAARPRSFLQTARALKLAGPPDWSVRFEEYLYGDVQDAAR